MSQNFQPGDFLIFQIESGYGLLRVLAVYEETHGTVWHLIVYCVFLRMSKWQRRLLPMAQKLTVSHSHLALTNRAFESTQVSQIGNAPLSPEDLTAFDECRKTADGEAFDRAVRIMLGVR